MAIETLIDTLPAQAVTLQADQHLRFLELVESAAMPRGTRAYLVGKADDGERFIKPVSDRASVLDIRNDLLSHLSSTPQSDEFLTTLKDYCVERLGIEQISPAALARRFALGFKAAADIQSIALHLQVTLSHSIADAHDEVVVALLLRRVVELSAVTCGVLEQGLEQQCNDSEELAQIVDPDAENAEVSHG